MYDNMNGFKLKSEIEFTNKYENAKYDFIKLYYSVSDLSCEERKKLFYEIASMLMCNSLGNMFYKK